MSRLSRDLHQLQVSNHLTRKAKTGSVGSVPEAKLPDPRVVAQNIISEHGRPAFQKLIEMFRDNVSGEKIGFVFKVSRQRVSQWRVILGKQRFIYEVNPEIIDLVEPRPRNTKRTAV